jgi:histidinol-phosphate aminotransferase
VRPPYNISVLNYECALFAHRACRCVRGPSARACSEQRGVLLPALEPVAGVRTHGRADANMILVRVPDAQKTFDGLKAQGVLIKNVSKMHPMLANCLRLTVGTAAEEFA